MYYKKYDDKEERKMTKRLKCGTRIFTATFTEATKTGTLTGGSTSGVSFRS